MSTKSTNAPVWYDVHNPHNKFAIGQVQVVGNKIVAATNAYRWAIGSTYDEFSDHCFRKGYHLAKRFIQVAKNIATSPGTYRKPNPATRELLRRLGL